MLYNIVLADPAWSYAVYSSKGKGRSAEHHYPTMDLKDICALPVADIAAKDCALFLWATVPNLPQALEVMKSWGFRYKTTAFCWVKQTPKRRGFHYGMGYWTRQNVELCLFGTRGSPRRISCGVPSLIISPRGKHSQKPDEVRDRIVKLLGDLPRVELFAREATPGWSCWGNQAPGSIELPGVPMVPIVSTNGKHHPVAMTSLFEEDA